MEGRIGRGSVWMVVLALAGGCDGDDSGDEAASTTGGVATTSGPSTDTGPASTGIADSSSGDPAPMGPPVCTKTCIVPGECCPPGVEGCPSSDYPNNWSCVDDLCVPPQCMSDAECGGLSCLPLYGVNTCLTACSGDEECAGISDISVCTGMADDGQGFCLQPCTEPGVSCGNALCDEQTGLCTCSSDTQCVGDDRCI